MDDAWVALTRYKLLEDRVKELRTKAWVNLPPSDDIEQALEEAEGELIQLKAWIDINFKLKKID